MLAEHLAMGPFYVMWSFLSFHAPIFIPLSFLNTWHFWKRLNKPPALSQA
jgi:hypothetical protein